MARVTVRDFDFDAADIERRKQLVRDLWAGKAVDHLPIHLVVTPSACPYSVREQFQNADKQLEVALTVAGLSYRCVPGGDYIPAMRPDVGCSCLAAAFGAEMYWGVDENQTCGVKEPVLRDVEQAYSLSVPEPDMGLLGEGTDRVRLFAEAGEGLVAVSLLDMAGGLNVALDLLGGDALYLAMYENPHALECLLDKIQELFLAAIALQMGAAGGEERIASLDFPDYWFPEGRKGHVSDDVSANISPAMYRRFSIPYHDRVFARYGGGGLHNCGPNPCLAQYLEHTPAPRALDLSYRYSACDFPQIKQVCRKRALLYIDIPGGALGAADAYRALMDLLAPDVAAIPVVTVTEDDDPVGVYRRMREVSEEYARRMDWGWDDG